MRPAFVSSLASRGRPTFIDESGNYQYMEEVGVYESSAINLNDYGLVTAFLGLYDFYNFDLSNQAANYHDFRPCLGCRFYRRGFAQRYDAQCRRG